VSIQQPTMCMQQLFYDVFKSQDTRGNIFNHHKEFVEDEKIIDCINTIIHIYDKCYKYTEDDFRDAIRELAWWRYYDEISYDVLMQNDQYCKNLRIEDEKLDKFIIEYLIKNKVPLEKTKLTYGLYKRDNYYIANYYLKLLKKKELIKLYKDYLIIWLKHSSWDIETCYEEYFGNCCCNFKCQVCHNECKGKDEGDDYYTEVEIHNFQVPLIWCWCCHRDRMIPIETKMDMQHIKKLEKYKIKKY